MTTLRIEVVVLEIIQLALTKASHDTLPVPSRFPIFAGARCTQFGAARVTTPVMTSPKPTTLLPPAGTDTTTVGPASNILEVS